MLLTSPAFVVGLALQIPVALVAWAIARWLLGLVGDAVLRTPVCARLGMSCCATIPIGALDPIERQDSARPRTPEAPSVPVIAMPPLEAARTMKEETLRKLMLAAACMLAATALAGCGSDDSSSASSTDATTERDHDDDCRDETTTTEAAKPTVVSIVVVNGCPEGRDRPADRREGRPMSSSS